MRYRLTHDAEELARVKAECFAARRADVWAVLHPDAFSLEERIRRRALSDQTQAVFHEAMKRRRAER